MITFKILSVGALTSLCASSAFGAAQSPDGRLVNAQAVIAMQTLEHFYGVQASLTTDGYKTFHVDQISCSLPATAATPACSLTVNGKVLPQPLFAADEAHANLFQLLADAGAAISKDGGLAASVSALDCSTGGLYGAEPSCQLKGFTPAAAPAATAKNVTFGGPAADALLERMMQLGVPSNVPPHTQYIWSNKADSVLCTVEAPQPYRYQVKPPSCSIMTNGVAIAAQGDDAKLFYRMIAESGGAALDQDSTFVATAGAFACVNNNTHSGGHATCVVTLPNPRQVLTSLQPYSISGATSFSDLLRSWSADVEETADATITKVAALECTMPTEQYYGIEAVDCRSSGNGGAVQSVAARREHGDKLLGLAGLFSVNPYAGRLDHAHPETTRFFGSMACTVNKTSAFPDGCQGYVLDVAPL